MVLFYSDGGTFPYWAIIVICLFIFTIKAVFLVRYWKNRKQQKELQRELGAAGYAQYLIHRDAACANAVRNETGAGVAPPTYAAATTSSNDQPAASSNPVPMERVGGLHPGLPIFLGRDCVQLGGYTLKVDDTGRILGCSCGLNHGGRIMMPKQHKKLPWAKKSKETVAATGNGGSRASTATAPAAAAAEETRDLEAARDHVEPPPPAVVAPWPVR